MRKVTGYIGALIIVMALMGSILAGYALNINGQSAVVNEYETVTDVSGLYSHTDQKTYIDYNPASNYIGYQYEQTTYDNPVPIRENRYKMIESGTITLNSGTQISHVPNYAVIWDYGYFYYENGTSLDFVSVGYNNQLSLLNATITKTGSTVTVSTSAGTTYTYNDCKIMLAYTSGDDWDYYVTMPQFQGSMNNVYVNDTSQIIGSTTSGGSIGMGIYVGNQWKSVGTTTTTQTITAITDITAVDNGVSSVTITDPSIGTWGSFYPRSVTSAAVTGIDYTESNRVNNYPIIINPQNTVVTESTINLMNISATDYWPSGIYPTDYGIQMDLKIYNWTPEYRRYTTITPSISSYVNSTDFDNHAGETHCYRLSDILASYSMPANTKTLKIDFDSNSSYHVYMGNLSPSYPYDLYIDGNIAGPVYVGGWTGQEAAVHNTYQQKDYLIYDVERGTVTTYDYQGIIQSTDTPDNVLITFTNNNSNTKYCRNTIEVGFNYPSTFPGAVNFTDLSGRPNPFMHITATSINPADISYIDITKGYTIKSTNITDTVWNNGYDNGEVNILFRAADPSGTYSNHITVASTDIYINYATSRFSVAVGSLDNAIDIGTWRAIMLNVDFENHKVTVSPVRTFNSYTNVTIDRSVIDVGDIADITPYDTASIIWHPTNNSLTFNVYSTSVFMDTYGVVMVGPTLDITNYFTDLNNFYRLKLSNFSIYGDSITVNDTLIPVSGNTITIDGKTLTLQNLYVTYADGNAYISDSNSTIDLGAITSNTVSMAGAWYFESYLEKGYTEQKLVYEWDWQDFILDNTQFCIFYILLALAGLIIARRFCSLSIIDYVTFITSLIIALGVQVIA